MDYDFQKDHLDANGVIEIHVRDANAPARRARETAARQAGGRGTGARALRNGAALEPERSAA